MKINAYVLAADPAWLVESVTSYYPLVNRIVVSYDKAHTSWTGTALPVEQCLEMLDSLDTEHKLALSPGHYARLDQDPLDNDTYQRQCALDEASDGSDWVIQLDTDEVVADSATFVSALRDADARGFGGLEFPARNLYQHITGDRYLEMCRRFWRVAAGYPGPVAIRADARLKLCRQSDITLYRVDFAARNTDPAHPASAPVHRVIRADQGIFHYTWIRDPEYMYRKSRWSGHARQLDWDRALRHWTWSGRHPCLAALASPLREVTERRGTPWLRPARVTHR